MYMLVNNYSPLKLFYDLGLRLCVGIYYLTLHKNRSPFCGIDLNKEEDRKRLSTALGWLADKLFALRSKRERMNVIAERLRQGGGKRGCNLRLGEA